MSLNGWGGLFVATLRMQPTFRLEVPGRADDAAARLRRAIASPELADHADARGRTFDFTIEPADRRFWSPHLGVQLSDIEGQAPATEVHGRFSPRPEVWTMVMMIYFGAATMALFAIVYGYAQWMIGLLPWAFALAPACLLLIAALHAASLIGQRLSADQMTLLRERFDRACEIAFEGGEA